MCKLGFVKVKFGVFNPTVPTEAVELDGVVDTGAMYSVIPRSLLEKLKIKLLERGKFRASVNTLRGMLVRLGLSYWGEDGRPP